MLHSVFTGVCMKAFSKILFAGLLVGGVSAPAFAQASATTNATSTVTIITPITLAKDTDLRFGTLIRPATGSATVTINQTTGAITVGSGALAYAGTTGRATYTITGETGYAYTIDPDDTVAMVAQTGSGADITVTLTPSSTGGTLTGGTTPGSSTATFGVGGTFSLTSGQGSGAYSGTFATVVAYN